MRISGGVPGKTSMQSVSHPSLRSTIPNNVLIMPDKRAWAEVLQSVHLALGKSTENKLPRSYPPSVEYFQLYFVEVRWEEKYRSFHTVLQGKIQTFLLVRANEIDTLLLSEPWCGSPGYACTCLHASTIKCNSQKKKKSSWFIYCKSLSE